MAERLDLHPILDHWKGRSGLEAAQVYLLTQEIGKLRRALEPEKLSEALFYADNPTDEDGWAAFASSPFLESVRREYQSKAVSVRVALDV